MQTTIYALIDPVTNQLRYIGKTNNVKARYRSHLSTHKSRKNTHKVNWVLKLKQQGLKPELEIIDIVSTDEWKYWEIFWISYYKSIGCNLLNYTIGGDGLTLGNQTSYQKGQGSIPIYQIDLTGNIVNEFESTLIASKQLKFRIFCTDKSFRTSNNFIFYKKETWNNLTIEEKNKIIQNVTTLKYEKTINNKNCIATRFKKGIATFIPSKKVNQLDKNTNEILNTFTSIKEAKEKTGAGHISEVILKRGKNKTSGGYKWEYA